MVVFIDSEWRRFTGSIWTTRAMAFDKTRKIHIDYIILRLYFLMTERLENI